MSWKLSWHLFSDIYVTVLAEIHNLSLLQAKTSSRGKPVWASLIIKGREPEKTYHANANRVAVPLSRPKHYQVTPPQLRSGREAEDCRRTSAAPCGSFLFTVSINRLTVWPVIGLRLPPPPPKQANTQKSTWVASVMGQILGTMSAFLWSQLISTEPVVKNCKQCCSSRILVLKVS